MPKTKTSSQLSSNARVVSGNAANFIVNNVTLHGSPIESEINLPSMNFAFQGSIGDGVPVAALQDSQIRSGTPNGNGSGANSPTIPLTDLDDPTGIYTTLTGLKSGSPTIVLTSEFIPLYDQGSTSIRLTDQGNAIKLKQEAKLITAATSINVLSQSLPVKNFLINNKQQIKEFLDGLGAEGSVITKISRFATEYYGLNSKFFPSKHTSSSNSKFSTILNKTGYNLSDISNFSESKVWLQSLFELKKVLLSNTNVIQTFSREPFEINQKDKDTAKISKISNYRIVLNLSTLTRSLRLEGVNLEQIVDSFPDYEEYFLEYERSMYSRLKKIENLSNTDFSESYLLESNGEQDLSIAASNVLKELIYSNNFGSFSLTGIVNEIIPSYPLDERENYKAWDALVGIIPELSTDIIDNSNNNKLFSLCQNNDSPGPLVYVFENFSPAGANNAETGFKYYMDGSLDSLISTGQNDLSRLISLEEKCTRILNSFDTITKLAGLNRSYSLESSYETIRKLFQSLTENNTSPGWSYLSFLAGIDQNMRIPSLIMKLSLRRDIPQLRSLKMHLFMWFYFQARQANRSSSERDYTLSIRFALDKIIEDIYNWRSSTSSLDATKENEAYKIKLENTTGYSQADDIETLFKRDLIRFFENSKVCKSILDHFSFLIRYRSNWSIDGRTCYSGLQVEKFLYAYFDVMMRIIGLQVPEEINRIYSVNSQQSTKPEITIIVAKSTQETFSSYFSLPYNGGDPAINYMKKIKRVQDNVLLDVLNKHQYLYVFGEFIESLREVARNAKRLITSDPRLSSYLRIFNSVFSAEDQNNFSNPSSTKNMMIKYAMTPSQTRNLDYVYNELRERLSPGGDLQNNLRQLPAVNGLFPSKDFTDFLPINPISLVSHQILASYYKSEEFQPRRGNNKRIISIGIPPGLVDKINSSRSNPVSDGIVRLKIWKIDRLYPDVLFQPLSYVFDMNMYPTRSPVNWNLGSLINNFDILNVPLKYYSPTAKVFSLRQGYRDFIELELEGLYQSDAIYFRLLEPEDDKRDELLREIYKNQVLSYLCEEYLGWYTDEDFSEMNYCNYYNKPSSTGTENYQRIIDVLQSTVPSFAQNTVNFTDFTTGQVIKFPISTLQTTSTNPQESSSPVQEVDLTNTAVSYLRNLSFASNVQTIKKRLIFPKKFERVFNVLIDPDDFQLEPTTSESKKTKLLSGPFVQIGGVIKRKETSEDKISLNEFFVTIEPYDYSPTRNI